MTNLKSLSLFMIILLLLSSFVLAVEHTSSTSTEDGSLSFKGVIDGVLGIGQLNFLFGGDSPDNQFIGFVRILLGVLVFTLIYLGLSMIPAFSRGVAIAIGIVLTVLVSIFIPATVLLAWGTTYATFFAFVVVFGPMIGMMMALLFTPTPNRPVAFLKLVVVLVLWWLVAHIAVWATRLGSVTASNPGGLF